MAPLQTSGVWYGAGSIVWWISAALVVGVTLSWLVVWWASSASSSSGARVVLADARASRPGPVHHRCPERMGRAGAPARGATTPDAPVIPARSERNCGRGRWRSVAAVTDQARSGADR